MKRTFAIMTALVATFVLSVPGPAAASTRPCTIPLVQGMCISVENWIAYPGVPVVENPLAGPQVAVVGSVYLEDLFTNSIGFGGNGADQCQVYASYLSLTCTPTTLIPTQRLYLTDGVPDTCIYPSNFFLINIPNGGDQFIGYGIWGGSPGSGGTCVLP